MIITTSCSAVDFMHELSGPLRGLGITDVYRYINLILCYHSAQMIFRFLF